MCYEEKVRQALLKAAYVKGCLCGKDASSWSPVSDCCIEPVNMLTMYSVVYCKIERPLNI